MVTVFYCSRRSHFKRVRLYCVQDKANTMNHKLMKGEIEKGVNAAAAGGWETDSLSTICGAN